ncbi:MAG: class I SAM-dependent methyltransferase [Sporomusaceae bacterium]|nr:class I SAM-dependent methyltransferase [Sporomusaceae bacterium]
MKPVLSGVPETLLIPLWARAVESRRDAPIITDAKAVEMMASIDYDFTKFEQAWKSQIGVVIRTEILNTAVAEFIRQAPAAVIVNIGCGLDTRYAQVDNGQIYWYDLDLPEPIQIRRRFFSETDRYKMIARSVFDYSWLDEIAVAEKPVLLIAEGTLMYFSEQEVIDLLAALHAAFPRAQMLLEIITPAIVKMSSHHDSVGKMNARFQWGVKSSRELETYHSGIKVVNEWNLFDCHRDRWGWMGWLAQLPAFRNRFSDRIVQLAFV